MPYAPDSTLSPRRLTAIAAVVLLHVGLIIGLKNGLARQIVEIVKGPLDVKIIQEEVVQDKEPPPPPIKIETPPPFVPPPEISIELPAEPPPASTISAVITPPPVTPAPRAQPVSGTALRLDMRRSPSTDEYYPPTSRRMGEEGTSTVGVCVGPDGRVVSGSAKLEETSNSARLDEAALKYALRTRWIPATESGKPVQACSVFRVKFMLTENGRR